MIAYVDASVILRVVLGEGGRINEWSSIDRAVASALTEVECLRTLDRLARRDALSPDDHSERRAAIFRILEACEVVDLTRVILRRASEPFPTPLGTLDAIHLATALAWRETTTDAISFATHDRELALAASAMGLEVLGSPVRG